MVGSRVYSGIFQLAAIERVHCHGYGSYLRETVKVVKVVCMEFWMKRVSCTVSISTSLAGKSLSDSIVALNSPQKCDELLLSSQLETVTLQLLSQFPGHFTILMLTCYSHDHGPHLHPQAAMSTLTNPVLHEEDNWQSGGAKVSVVKLALLPFHLLHSLLNDRLTKLISSL